MIPGVHIICGEKIASVNFARGLRGAVSSSAGVLGHTSENVQDKTINAQNLM